MSKALPIAVREFVHALFLQGMRRSTIIEETKRQHGVTVRDANIRQWIMRYNWNTTVSQTKAILERRVSEPILTSQVAKQSQSVRERFAQAISHTSELLSKRPPKGLKQALAIQEALEPAVRNANKVFGWDQQSSSTVASVQSLSSDLPEPELRKTVESPVLNSGLVPSEPAQLTQPTQSEDVSK